jgi:arylsulfatase A-like enzyme
MFVRFLALSLMLACSAEPTHSPTAVDAPEVTQKPSGPMNLLFIAVDTLRADHLGSYGFKRPTSTNIDALMADSTVFIEAMATAPWTLPSFASMMTSQHSSTTGVWRFKSTLDPSFSTLAEQLAAADYHTGAVVGHLFLAKKFGLNQGFQEYDQALVKETLGESHKALTSHAITDKSIGFIDRHIAEQPDKPWFLWAHYFDPHTQYKAIPGLVEIFGKHRRARYNGEIAYTDHHIGRLLKHLKKTGQDKNTMVVFVSDHGEEFQDHGDRLHGKTLYREVMRVPLSIRVPGVSAQRIQQPVSTVDLMPTLLELLEAPVPKTPMAGQSLAPLFRGEPVPRTDLLMESALTKSKKSSLKGIIHGDWKLIVETPNKKAAKAGAKPTTKLFRSKHDRKEKEDMTATRLAVVASMKAQLKLSLDQALARRAEYHTADVLQHSAEEIEQLEALGYVEASDDVP